MKNKVKKHAFFLLNLVFNRGIFLPSASILMYHSVGQSSVPFTVNPQEFERQMKYLKDNSYNVIPLGELLENLRKNANIAKKTVSLTFDDGYRDNYYNASSVLQKYSFPATFFIPVKYIGGEINNSKNMPIKTMNWREIEELHNSGLADIEPHSLNHAMLSEMPENEARYEIEESKKIIEKKLNKKCELFCYPHGGYNELIVNIVKDAGFLGAVTTEERNIWKNRTYNSFKLPRMFMRKDMSFGEFKAKLCRSSEIYNKIKNII